MERRKNIFALALALILLQAEVASSANILAIFPSSSKSQSQVYTAITRALAQRGHSCTVVTSRPLDRPPPNYRQIDVHDIVAPHLEDFNVGTDMGILDTIGKLDEMAVDVCREVMQRSEVMELTRPEADGTTFDLIFVSSFFGECYYPFAHIYNAPIVVISPVGPVGNTNVATGNALLPSYFAEPFLGYGDRMNFRERLENTLAHFASSLFYRNYVQRRMEHEMRAAFGDDTPSISELEERVSLVVLNHHFSLNQARATVPCLIEAGGLHIGKEKRELPKDLKAFLDGSAKEGVIYFSLGSFLRSSRFSNETRDELMAAFSQLKQRVLWKWEGPTLPGQPDNVRVEAWLPQQEVLAHPSIKLFITHGGLLSFQEAVSMGVPLIGMPFFGDQRMNVNRMLDLKVGVKLDPNNITAANVLDAIDQVLGNPEYAENMKRLQAIVTDQRDDPLERAVYWIEYVLRHDGAKHLKPASFHLHWSQICLLDVLLVTIVIPTSITVAAAFLLVKLLKRKRKCSGNDGISKKKSQ